MFKTTFVNTICNATKGDMVLLREDLESKSIEELKDAFINLTVLQATLQQVRMVKKNKAKRNELTKRQQYELQRERELAKDLTDDSSLGERDETTSISNQSNDNYFPKSEG